MTLTRSQWTSTLFELVVNFFLPWLVYRLALPHLSSLGALYASAVPPLAWSLIEFVKVRRVDALSAIVLGGIALSIFAMALGGSERIVLVRESLVSGVIGVVFLFSLFMRRPLVFHLARAAIARKQAASMSRFETVYGERPQLRAVFHLMTLVWGTGLTAETVLRCWLAWQWPIERCLVVLPIISYAIYGTLMLWTFWIRRRLQQPQTSRNAS
jgi:hypothetical protein